MGADANIFQQYLKPVKTVADYSAERDAATDRKNAAQMNALQLAALTQKTERDNAFRTLVSTAPADPAERVKALRASGNPEAMQHADALEKNQLDMGKVRADTDKAAADAHGKNLEAKIKAHDFSLQQLQGVNDPESAHLWAISELKNGSVTPEQFMQGVSKIPSDPAQFQAWKKAAMQSGVSVLDNMKIENENARNKLNNDTSIANNTATNATSRANNAANNAVSMRGQNLVDARAKDTLAQGGKPPAGYRWSQTGGLEPIPGGPGAARATEVEYKREERDNARGAKRDAVGAQIAVIDKALNHPGRNTATGLSGSIDPRNFIAGTDATDFRTVLDQIGGATFLQAFESLKGGGQITEVEGKKATDAIARLSRAQSDGEFETSLKDLRAVMVKGQERLSAKNAQQPDAPQQPAKTQGGSSVSNW